MNPTPKDLEKYAALARSPTGQSLLALLQASGGQALKDAMAQAQQGNYQAAQEVLSPLLASGQIQSLLRQLEENL